MMGCTHERILRATNVTAAVSQAGYMTSGTKVVPLPYAVLDYCSHPCCEKVFKAERAE